MGDFHFIVRHALTGVILLVFLFIGLFIFNEPLWVFLQKNFGSDLQKISSFLPLLVSAPVIGISIQGLYIALLQIRRAAFTDPARVQVANRIKERLVKTRIPGMTNDITRMYLEAFNSMPNDALFVWLYHTDAPAHLIEWARRRRSYHYLGVNWAIAAILGFILAGLSVVFLNQITIKFAIVIIFPDF